MVARVPMKRLAATQEIANAVRYLAGDELSLADIGIGIFAHRWLAYPVKRPPSPHLKAWYERLAERPGFAAHVAGPVS